jgi:hypothetical protein
MLRLGTLLLGMLLVCELGCGTSTKPTSSQNPSGNNATPKAAAAAPLISSISPVSVPAGTPDADTSGNALRSSPHPLRLKAKKASKSGQLGRAPMRYNIKPEQF